MNFFRIPGTHNSVLTMARSCADLWPYNPKYKQSIRHPSQSYVLDTNYIYLRDVGVRTLALALRTMRKASERMLEDEDVRHFEIQVINIWAGGGHSGCMGEECPVCEWLYYTDYEDGYLFGWLAVVRNKDRSMHDQRA